MDLLQLLGDPVGWIGFGAVAILTLPAVTLVGDLFTSLLSEIFSYINNMVIAKIPIQALRNFFYDQQIKSIEKSIKKLQDIKNRVVNRKK